MIFIRRLFFLLVFHCSRGYIWALFGSLRFDVDGIYGDLWNMVLSGVSFSGFFSSHDSAFLRIVDGFEVYDLRWSQLALFRALSVSPDASVRWVL